MEIWQNNCPYFIVIWHVRDLLVCSVPGHVYLFIYFTFILSIESSKELAWWMRYVCSIYSVSLCRKLSGSLKITGMVILDSSWKRYEISQNIVLIWSVLTEKERLHDSKKLTMPMHFLSMLQMLKSFLENMGAGKLVLWNNKRYLCCALSASDKCVFTLRNQ